jgi:K+-transporting ATPase ATPase C chain
MRRQLLPALGMVIIFTIITGLAYPLVVTGFAQTAFGDKADGSLVKRNGEVVGSRLIGQTFTEPQYFHPRPSAVGYVPGAQGGGVYSAGSNYGPTNPNLIGNVPGVSITEDENPYAHPDDPFCVPVEATDDEGNAITDDEGNPVYEMNDDDTYVCNADTVPQRVLAYREANGLADGAEVPIDAVTGSSSALDPQISVANARIQAARVAEERGLELDEVLDLVDEHTDGRGLGFLGESGVNVLELNLALDDLEQTD